MVMVPLVVYVAEESVGGAVSSTATLSFRSALLALSQESTTPPGKTSAYTGALIPSSDLLWLPSRTAAMDCPLPLKRPAAKVMLAEFPRSDSIILVESWRPRLSENSSSTVEFPV